MNTDKLNEAIGKHLHSWISDTDRTAILNGYGIDVLSLIEEICSFAANDPVWSEPDYLKSFKDCMHNLKQRYPYLTEDSARRAATIAAYYWK